MTPPTKPTGYGIRWSKITALAFPFFNVVTYPTSIHLWLSFVEIALKLGVLQGLLFDL
jgi:hypothetical protein